MTPEARRAAIQSDLNFIKYVGLDTEADADMQWLLDQLTDMQAQLDRLTGMKFSDRVHAALVARAERAEAELEETRMRLIACSVAALGNTPDSVKHRLNRKDSFWSAAYEDVCRAVDREIALRDERDALKNLLAFFRMQIDDSLKCPRCGGTSPETRYIDCYVCGGLEVENKIGESLGLSENMLNVPKRS